nr:hypothetical protein BaRGS_022978 [Batillaria attramentaria]
MLDVPVQPGGRYAFQGYVKLTNSSQSTKIWQLFKAVMIFDVTLPTGVQPSEIDLQIDLKKHLFGFGTLVKDIRIKQQPTNAYSKLVFNLFNWATVQTYKWKLQKGNETHPDFSSALEVTDILNSNGLKVRGHSIFWNVEDNIPDWVKAKTNAELPQVLFSHLDYIVNVSLGKLAHWDVQNEHIYSHYYEERLGPAYANLTKDFFRSVKELDPVTKLYYNDFTGVTSGAHTQEMHDLMLEYLSEGVPVEGLGIQGHTKNFTRPDPTMMWKRLDLLGELGLELFMTEFDVGWPEVVQRADWLEDAIRALFAHPKLSGVILWGFLDVDMFLQSNHALVSGEELRFLETGERFACLVKKEWSTHVTKNLAQSGLTFDMRGFQGDYEVIVKKNGVPVQVETFSLGTSPTTVNLQVTTNTAEVQVVEEYDYVPQCISHRARASLGNQTANTTDTQLSCRIAYSAETGLGEDDMAVAKCSADEILTSCSAFHMSKGWTRNGDKIVMENGVATCQVYNGRNSNDGVKAFAMCCKVSGLTCDYRTAGPSSPMDGAQAEATCPSGYTPLGLVAGDQKWTSCPAGYQMTGCSAYAESGKGAGAKIFDVAKRR